MPSNNHTIAKQTNIKRGAVTTYDGTVLAESVDNGDGTYSRVYPAGDLAAHVIGYYSQTYGTSGIEASQNDILQGNRSYASWSDVLAAMSGGKQTGNDVVLTLNTTIQQAAQDALAGQTGACIVMDPETGAVLAMASSPTYSTADFESVIKASSNDSSSGSLINRATQSLYAPGSTFKMVTLATALENNVADENTVFDSPGTMEIGGAAVTNFDSNNYGRQTLAQATAWSSNTVFGQLGVQIGASALVKGADGFGFDSKISFDLPTAMSLMTNPKRNDHVGNGVGGCWPACWRAFPDRSVRKRSADGPGWLRHRERRQGHDPVPGSECVQLERRAQLHRVSQRSFAGYQQVHRGSR